MSLSSLEIMPLHSIDFISLLIVTQSLTPASFLVMQHPRGLAEMELTRTDKP